MASTKDCKQLLESHPVAGPQGASGWKRLGKRNIPGGNVRIFSNSTKQFFVRVVEIDGRLAIDKMGTDLDEVQQAPLDQESLVFEPAPEAGMAEVDLFQLYPPELGIDEDEMRELIDDDDGEMPFSKLAKKYGDHLRNHLSGRFVYGLLEDSFDIDTSFMPSLPFYFGYETKQGYLYDQHAPAYEDFLLAAFPEFSDRLSVGDSEGRHSIELIDDEDPRQLWAVFVKRFEQLGVVQMGAPAGDHKVVLSADDPILGKRAGRSSAPRP